MVAIFSPWQLADAGFRYCDFDDGKNVNTAVLTDFYITPFYPVVKVLVR